jgi:Zn-dependent peptidase ImmA (M78 family)/DNA-binding XRE family transcriptional regulator
MSSRVPALVAPELLTWARKKAGLDVEAAAKKADVAPDRLAAFEDGSAHPSIPQARRLAHVYGRTLALFYLPEPPRDFPPIKHYRVARQQRRPTPSPELLAEIEAAHERRAIALELINGQAPTFPVQADTDGDPEALARSIRDELGIDAAGQSGWVSSRVAFNAWRSAIEERGALVVQMVDVHPDEARGFSISERPFPVVAVNNGDPFVARSFTAIHELVHVVIHVSGVCDLNVRRGRVEPFCNYVAGAVLVPAEALLKQHVVVAHGDRREWSDEALVEIAQSFRVSREVVLRRLLIVGKTDEAFYGAKRRQLLREYRRRRERGKPSGGWGPSPATMAIARSGRLFSRLVLDRYSTGAITPSDVATYLGVRMKHVPSIEQQLASSARG